MDARVRVNLTFHFTTNQPALWKSDGMAFVAASRLKAITRLQCEIFQTSYNPIGIRTGAKYLRARLRGPSMVKYYPEELNLSKLARQYPELEMIDEDEEQRFQDVADRKKRGKGAPKKAKTKGTFSLALLFTQNTHFPCRRQSTCLKEEEVRLHAFGLLLIHYICSI